MSSAALHRRAYLGFEAQLADDGSRSQFAIVYVEPAGPAAQAGLKLEDRLLSVAGTAPATLAQLRRLVAQLAVNEPCELLVERRDPSQNSATHCLCPIARAMPLESLPKGRIELDQVEWGEHRLRAIWSLPEGRGPFPAVWLIPGATWLSEEQPLGDWEVTLNLVRALSAEGFATLRVERSGMGDSEGPDCRELDLHAELSSLTTGREHFFASPRVDPNAAFIYGRSLGGMLVPLLAQRQRFSGAAVWGSSADSWHTAMLTASERQFRFAGLRGEALTTALSRVAALQELVYLQGLSPSAARAKRPDLEDVQREAFHADRIYDRAPSYFQQLQACDFAAAWRAVSCPVLAIRGDHDWLSHRDDLVRIAELARDGRVAEVPNLDHNMHRRPSLQAAFDEPWGGSFDDAGAKALIAFFRECQTRARRKGSGNTPP